MGIGRAPGTIGLDPTEDSIPFGAGIGPFVHSCGGGGSLDHSLYGSFCEPERIKGFKAFVTKGVAQPNGKKPRWIVGPYSELARLAGVWRHNIALSATLLERGVWIGRRSSDRPPTGAPTEASFRSKIEGQAPSPGKDKHLRTHGDLTTDRLTDQFEAALKYYQDRTLEAHHIVEKGLLKRVKLIKGPELEDANAPCVLIVAELHRRLFTSEVARQRSIFIRGMDQSVAVNQLRAIYAELYTEQLAELNAIAGVILSHISRQI